MLYTNTFHVLGAPAVDAALGGDVCGERVADPLVLLHRDHIGVGVQEYCRGYKYMDSEINGANNCHLHRTTYQVQMPLSAYFCELTELVLTSRKGRIRTRQLCHNNRLSSYELLVNDNLREGGSQKHDDYTKKGLHCNFTSAVCLPPVRCQQGTPAAMSCIPCTQVSGALF